MFGQIARAAVWTLLLFTGFACTQCACKGNALGVQMPRYYFTVRASEGDAGIHAAELNDDAAALAYACEIAREVMQSCGSTDRSLQVNDETRPMVLSIPFLAACT